MRQKISPYSQYISSKQKLESSSPSHSIKRNKLQNQLLKMLQTQSPKNLTIKNPLFEIVPQSRKYLECYNSPIQYQFPKQKTLPSLIIKSQLSLSRNLDLTPKRSPKCVNIHTQRRLVLNN